MFFHLAVENIGVFPNFGIISNNTFKNFQLTNLRYGLREKTVIVTSNSTLCGLINEIKIPEYDCPFTGRMTLVDESCVEK